MNRHILAAIVILLLVPLMASAQFDKSPRRLYKDAGKLMDDEQFADALLIYQHLLRTDSLNANLNFKAGFAMLKSTPDNEQTIDYMQHAVENIDENYKDKFRETAAPTMAYFYLGKAYQANYKFQEAIDAYETMLNEYGSNNEALTSRISRQIETCYNGIELLKSPVEITTLNLGAGINSPYNDHSPVIAADESVLIFTSTRQGSTGGKKDKRGNFYEDIYIAYNENDMWTPPTSIGPNINTDDHEASIGLSVDGRQLFVYKSNKGNGDIYTCQQQNDVWGVPQPLGETINSKYSETHASLSADGNYLFFTSNRKGGLGGFDIYMAEKQSNDTWGEAVNLGETINTPYNEKSPYMHPDGVTLYFSSEGHNTMGGYDIFTSVKNEEGEWQPPQNIGYPINTPHNDIFYTPTLDNKRAYYSSSQKSGSGDLDLYVIEFPHREALPIALLSGVVTSEDGEVLPHINVTAIDADSGRVIAEAQTNVVTGEFLFVIHPEVNYYILYQSNEHLFFSERFQISKESANQTINRRIELQPIVAGETSQEYGINFEPNSDELSESGKIEVENISQTLKINQDLVVELSHTNNRLSFARFQEIYNDLLEQNVSKDQIIEILVEGMGNGVGVNVADVVYLENREKTYELQFLENNEGISEESEQQLTDLVAFVGEQQHLGIEIIETHSDAISEQQTEYVISRLVEMGIEEHRISTEFVEQVDANHYKVSMKITNLQPNQLMYQSESFSLQSILFDYDKYQTSDYDDVFDKLSNYANDNPETVIKIKAYTDAHGSESYNQQLSQRRANFVKQDLMSRGVSESQIVTEALGETHFIAPNTDAEGRQYNRRVDIEVLTNGQQIIASSDIEVPHYLDLRYTIVVVKQKEELPPDYFYHYPVINNVRTHVTSEGYLYSVGTFVDNAVAEAKLQQVQAAGFPGATLVHRFELTEENIVEQTVDTREQITTSAGTDAGTFYSVQLLAVRQPVNLSYFSGLNDVVQIQEDGLYKYITGSYESYNAARTGWQNVVNQGYDDAFIRTPNRNSGIAIVETNGTTDKTYYVQIKASRSQIGLSYFSGVNNLQEFAGNDGWYRYAVGTFSSYEAAKTKKAELIRAGYPDAFIVDQSKYW